MTFQLNCSNPEKHQAPDTTDCVHRCGIDPEFIISRDQQGNVLSQFKQDSWDCRVYGAKSTFNFDSWWDEKARGGPMDTLARTLTDEIKMLHWLSMFETTTNASRSRGISYLHQVTAPLRALAKIAHTLGIPLAQAHTNIQFQLALRSSIANSEQGLSPQSAPLELIQDVAYWQGVDLIEYEVPRLVSEDDFSEVLTLIKKQRNLALDQREQYPLIPTRLLSKIIGDALNQLKEAEPHLPALESYFKAVNADPSMSANSSTHYRYNVKRVRSLYPTLTFPSWPEAKDKVLSTAETLERFQLTAYAKKTGFRDLQSIDGLISHLQVLCIFLIHAFTGMRTSELQVMPFEPIAHSSAKGFRNLPVLVSHLKKFTVRGNYSRPLVWATSAEGVYAVRIAQQLTQLKWYRNNPVGNAMPKDIPLLASTKSAVSDHYGHYALPCVSHLFNTDKWYSVCQSIGLVIEQEDLEELRVFDAFRAWDEDPRFTVGKIWPLTSHQFRRSVAVYASRSGMVSLPTLKSQYKHLSEVMTALYAENSTYAQSFLIDENGKPIDNSSVLESFRDAVAFNTSVRFHEQVIKSETQLSGPTGSEIQRAKERNKLPKIFTDSKETTKAVKQGRFSYRETPVGGCVKKGSCPHFVVDLVLPCTNGCTDAILIPEKLESYVDSLRFDLESVSPNSRPYQLIAQEIEYVTSKYLQPAEIEQ